MNIEVEWGSYPDGEAHRVYLTVYSEHSVCDLIPDDEILDLSEIPTVTADSVKTGDSK